MKIALVAPPWTEKNDDEKTLKSIHSITPPLGLLYIASYLRENGYEPTFLDAAVLNLNVDETVERILNLKPDIVGFTATTPSIDITLKAIIRLKQRNPEIKIILGGPHVTAVPKETMEACPSIDFSVIGEGEITILEILDKLSKGEELKDVKGIAYRGEDKVKITAPRPFIEDLDILPFPARDLALPLEKYSLAPSDYKRKPATTMITSRGCPYNCVYCNKAIFGRRYRAHTPDYVVNEIQHLIREYGIKEIKLWDDVFVLDKKRVESICEMIEKRGIDISWSCESRVNLVNKDLLKMMKEAGCWQIDYGIESGNQNILDSARKSITLEQAENAITWSHEIGISTRAYFMLGLPEETIETAEETIRFSKKLNLDFATFFITTPYPGTDLYTIAEEQNSIISRDWAKYSHVNIDDPVYAPTDISAEEMKRLMKKAYKAFYWRPGYVLKTMISIRRYEDIKKLMKASQFLLKKEIIR